MRSHILRHLTHLLSSPTMLFSMLLLQSSYKVKKIYPPCILGNIPTYMVSKVINFVFYQFRDSPDWSRFCDCNSHPTHSWTASNFQQKCLWETEKKKGFPDLFAQYKFDVVWPGIETWKSWSFQVFKCFSKLFFCY